MSAELNIKMVLLSFILFTMFIVGGVQMMAIARSKNSNAFSDEKLNQFNSSFNKLDELSSSISTTEAALKSGAEKDINAFGVLNAIILNVFNSIKMMGTTFSFIGTSFLGLYAIFGIPTWVGILASLMITTIIVFSILGSVFRWNF
jgi:hypothetical protein